MREAETTSPVPEMARRQVYHEAATYEARRRRAPVVEFDDLLVALLVPGTDLWTRLADLGQDPTLVRAEIDALRPRFETGPIFPEDEAIGTRLVVLPERGFSDLFFLQREPWDDAEPSPGRRLLRERGATDEAVSDRLEELGVEP